MDKKLKKAYGFLAGTAIGLLSWNTIAGVGRIYGLTSLPEFQKSRKIEIAQKYKGTAELERIIRSQTSQISYSQMDSGVLVASVNVPGALEKACATAEFAQTPACIDYSKIPAALEAQARINSNYDWIEPAQLGAFGFAVFNIAGAAIVYLGIDRENRRLKGQLENDKVTWP